MMEAAQEYEASELRGATFAARDQMVDLTGGGRLQAAGGGAVLVAEYDGSA